MSHFIGLVFGDDVDSLVTPYDENIEVDTYVRYTKEEAIDEVKRRKAENYEYALKVKEEHPENVNERIEAIIDKGLFISYEDAWEEVKKWGYELDDEENLLSNYNPDSKWDWYTEGGRWGAWLLLKEKGEDGEPLNAIFATKGEIDWEEMFKSNRVPFCFITEIGEWHETASMGWWGITTDDKDEQDWIQEFMDYLNTVSDDVEVTAIDFHI